MDQTNPGGIAATTGKRIAWIDLARAAALLAMAVYHLTWDLEFFGYVAAGTTTTGGWKLFARTIAASFIFLAGVSLVLGHYPTIRWRKYWRRLAMIGVAAMAITATTLYLMPSSFIFFGILHAIAAGSLVGLVFLRRPPAVTLVAAALVATAPFFLRAPVFDAPWLWWVGLSVSPPRSNDYVPILPWLAPLLTGIAVARIAAAGGGLAWLARRPPGEGRLTRIGLWSGRHSLAVYLLHQPVLFALVAAANLVAPAPAADPAQSSVRACAVQCADAGGEAFCQRYCACVVTAMQRQDLFDAAASGTIDVTRDPRVRALADQCTSEALQ